MNAAGELLRDLLLADEPTHGIALRTRMLVWGDIVLRTIEIPAGCTLAGARHEHEHVAMMVGAISVLDSGRVLDIVGAHEWVCPPGTMRVGRTHTATAWTTIHRIPHGMTNPVEIERYICGTDAPRLVTQRNPQLPAPDDVQ